MSNSDNIKMTDDEEALRSAESTLDTQVSICLGTAETAIKHAQNVLDVSALNVSALARIDMVIDLFKFFRTQAERFKDGGRPAVHDRVTRILADITATRATLTKTVRILNAADLEDMRKSGMERTKREAIGKAGNASLFAQGDRQAKETGKLL